MRENGTICPFRVFPLFYSGYFLLKSSVGEVEKEPFGGGQKGQMADLGSKAHNYH